MARILIIGYGNPLRSDDGLGWRAAEQLSGSLSFPKAEVEVVVRHQLTPELADDLKDVDAVFFIDAVYGGQPGELTWQPVVRGSSTPQSHECCPAALLTLARQLYGATPQAFAVSLCGECFDHGEAISAAVQAGLPKLAAMVEKLAATVIARV